MKIKVFWIKDLILRQQGQAMIDEVIIERTLEFVVMCKCFGVFYKMMMGAKFGRKMQLVYAIS